MKGLIKLVIYIVIDYILFSWVVSISGMKDPAGLIAALVVLSLVEFSEGVIEGRG